MGVFKKNVNKNYISGSKPADASFKEAFVKGDIITKLSLVILGLGNLLNKQLFRGVVLLLIEVAYIAFMITKGIGFLGGLATLGTAEQAKVYNEALGIYEYQAGDNSMLFLLFGVVSLLSTASLLPIWHKLEQKLSRQIIRSEG